MRNAPFAKAKGAFERAKRGSFAQSALALPLGELSCDSMTEGVIEYLRCKYSIISDFQRKSETLSDPLTRATSPEGRGKRLF